MACGKKHKKQMGKGMDDMPVKEKINKGMPKRRGKKGK